VKFRARWIFAALGVIVIGVVVWFWPAIRVIMAVGLPSKADKRQYEGTNQDNLKAIRTALLFYHDNEDRFPDASGWMDAIEKQLKTDDLTPEEAAKKLHDPSLSSGYGYAINDAFAGKYKGDVKDTKAPMVFQSTDPARNAHGDPKELGKGFGIALDGTILKIGAEKE
jgi:hypothetical protein